MLPSRYSTYGSRYGVPTHLSTAKRLMKEADRLRAEGNTAGARKSLDVALLEINESMAPGSHELRTKIREAIAALP
jgi:hypothetical protein